MALPDHEKPLSEYERRVLSELETALVAAGRNRRQRRRSLVRYSALLCLGCALAATVILAGLGLLAALIAAIVTGLLGALIGALAMQVWVRNHDPRR